MTERESAVNHRRRRRSRHPPSIRTSPPRWPGDPEHVEVGNVDSAAIAHVLANTCRWGGRAKRFFSLAQYALVVSEEAEALEGIAGEDRRALAPLALLTNVRTAWLGDETGDLPASTRAKAHGEKIDRAVREAAARRWLARFREPDGTSAAATGNVHAASSAADTAPASVAAEASS